MSRRRQGRPPLGDPAYTRPGPAGEGMGWLRRLGPFIRRYRVAVVATLVLSVVAQTLIGLLPLIQQIIVDHSILAKERPLGPMLLVLLSTGMLGFTANYGRRYLGAKVSVGIRHDLRLAIHRHLYGSTSPVDELGRRRDMRSTADLAMIKSSSSPCRCWWPTSRCDRALGVMFVLSPILGLVIAVSCRSSRGWQFGSERDLRPAGTTSDCPALQAWSTKLCRGTNRERPSPRRIEFARLMDRSHELYQSTCALPGSTRVTRRRCNYCRCSASSVCFPSGLARSRGTSRSVFLTFASFMVQSSPVRILSGSGNRTAGAGSERVFELLDLQPRVTDSLDARPLSRRAVSARRRLVRVRRRRRLFARHLADDSTRRADRARRCIRIRQDHAGPVAGSFLRPAQRSGAFRRDRCPRFHAVVVAAVGQRRVRGELLVLDHHQGEHRLRPTRRHGCRDRSCGARCPGPRFHPRSVARLRHGRRRSAATRSQVVSVSESLARRAQPRRPGARRRDIRHQRAPKRRSIGRSRTS